MRRLFKVGDRVRARTPKAVPAGTLGRIHTTLTHTLDVYFVLFDGERRVRLMQESDLEAVTDAPTDEGAT
jgi:Lon protease-like protein